MALSLGTLAALAFTPKVALNTGHTSPTPAPLPATVTESEAPQAPSITPVPTNQVPKRVDEESGVKLDSVLIHDDWNNINLTRELYAYDAYGYPSLREIYKWNAATKTYDYSGEEGFEWNASGYVLDYWINDPDDETGRITYKLDADNFVIEKTEYYYIKGDWVPNTRVTYTYNDVHNVTSEVHQAYTTELDMWTDTKQYYGIYDTDGLLIEYKQYVLTNGQMIPYRETYEYTLDGELEMRTVQISNPDNVTELINYQRRIYEYGVWGCTREDIQYWEESRQDWQGGTYRNAYLTYDYDELGRMIAEHSYQRWTPTDPYEELILTTWTYEDEADGAYTMIQETVYPIEGGDPEPGSKFEQHYLSWGGIDYTKSWYESLGVLKPQYETTCTFTEEHQVLDWQNYLYNDETPYTAARVTYDYEYGPYQWSRASQYAGDDSGTGWTPTFQLEREFENDAITYYRERKYVILFEDYGVYELVNGYDYEYDFSVPADNITAWVTYDWLYQLETERFQTDTSRTTAYYYYSLYDRPTSSITDITDSIENIDVTVTDLQGRIVYRGCRDGIKTAGLTHGVYVVTTGLKSVKIIL